MKLYRIHDRGEEESQLAGTLDAAKDIVNKTEPVFRAQVLVIECELPGKKDELIDALNKMLKKDFSGLTALRTWHGTQRGGLKLVNSDSQS